MMNIKELTTQQKSVMLARLVDEWEVVDAWSFGDAWIIGDKATGGHLLTINMNQDGDSLYDPAVMWLAWKVLNWSLECRELVKVPLTMAQIRTVIPEWFFELFDENPGPAVAQAAWLDKVLELAIEAGLVAEQLNWRI